MPNFFIDKTALDPDLKDQSQQNIPSSKPKLPENVLEALLLENPERPDVHSYIKTAEDPWGGTNESFATLLTIEQEFGYKGIKKQVIDKNGELIEIQGEKLTFSGDPQKGFLTEKGEAVYELKCWLNKLKMIEHHLFGMRIVVYSDHPEVYHPSLAFASQQGFLTPAEINNVFEENQKIILSRIQLLKQHVLYDETISLWDFFGKNPEEVFYKAPIGKAPKIDLEKLKIVVDSKQADRFKDVTLSKTKRKIDISKDKYKDYKNYQKQGPPPKAPTDPWNSPYKSKSAHTPRENAEPATKMLIKNFKIPPADMAENEKAAVFVQTDKFAQGENSMPKGGVFANMHAQQYQNPNSQNWSNIPGLIGGQSSTQANTKNSLKGKQETGVEVIDQAQKDLFDAISISAVEEFQDLYEIEGLFPWKKLTHQVKLPLDPISTTGDFGKLYIHLIPLKSIPNYKANEFTSATEIMYDKKLGKINHLDALKGLCVPEVAPSIAVQSPTHGTNQITITQNDFYANAVTLKRVHYPHGLEGPCQQEMILENYPLTDNMGPELVTDYIENNSNVHTIYSVVGKGPYQNAEFITKEAQAVAPGPFSIGWSSESEMDFGAGFAPPPCTILVKALSSQLSDDPRAGVQIHIGGLKDSELIGIEVFVENLSNRGSYASSLKGALIPVRNQQGRIYTPIESIGNDPGMPDWITFKDFSKYYDGGMYRYYVRMYDRNSDDGFSPTTKDFEYFSPQITPFSPSIDVYKIEPAAAQPHYKIEEHPYAWKDFVPKQAYNIHFELRLDYDYDSGIKLLSDVLNFALGEDAAKIYIDKFEESQLSFDEIAAFTVHRHYSDPHSPGPKPGQALWLGPGMATNGGFGGDPHIFLPGKYIDGQKHPTAGFAPYDARLPPFEGDALTYEATLYLRTPDFFFEDDVTLLPVSQAISGDDIVGTEGKLQAGFFKALTKTVHPTWKQKLGIQDDVLMENYYLANTTTTQGSIVDKMMLGDTGIREVDDVPFVGQQFPRVVNIESQMKPGSQRWTFSWSVNANHMLLSCVILRSVAVFNNAKFEPIAFVQGNPSDNFYSFCDPFPASKIDHAKYVVVPLSTDFKYGDPLMQPEVDYITFNTVQDLVPDP